jgi:hypothetical protein
MPLPLYLLYLLDWRLGGPQLVQMLWRREGSCTAVDLYETEIVLWCKDEEVEKKKW